MSDSINFKALVSHIGEAVVISDRDENILFWNASAERIFGYSPDEALGKTLSIITPERFRERHSKGYFHTMETGKTKYCNTLLRVPAIHKDGRSISIAFSVTMILMIKISLWQLQPSFAMKQSDFKKSAN